MSEWLKWQTDYLLENYNKKTNKELSDFIGKSEAAIQQKISYLELKRDAKHLSDSRSAKKIALKNLLFEWDKMHKLPPKE